jgi:D-amino-acid oxidase
MHIFLIYHILQIGTPDELVNKWGQYTFKCFQQEYVSSNGAKSGVQLMTAYNLFEEHEDDSNPSWSNIVFGFKRLEREELVQMGIRAPYTKGYSYATYVVDQKYFLQYLTSKLRRLGVEFVQQRVASLSHESLVDYDALINCSGLGAFSLLQDKQMYPIRGQVLRVR